MAKAQFYSLFAKFKILFKNNRIQICYSGTKLKIQSAGINGGILTEQDIVGLLFSQKDI